MLFTLILFVLPTQSRAASVSNGWKYEKTGTGIRILGYEGTINYGTSIPSKINGTSVTEIGSGAFSSQTKLYGIGIPETVKVIGNGAFANTNLSSVNIPKSVESIGYGAFNGKSLSSVTFQGNPKTLSEGCLGSNSKTVRVYSTATTVIKFCTVRSSYLHLEYMKTAAQEAAEKENNAVPEEFDVTDQYGTWTFNRTYKTITNYSGTANFVRVPERISKNGYNYTVNSIAFHAIHDNANMTWLEINVPVIGTEAVYKCTNLKRIELGNSVSFLGPYCFWHNDNLSYLYVARNPVTTISIFKPASDMYVASGYLSLYIRWYCYINNIRNSNDMDPFQLCSFRDTMMNAKGGLSNVTYWSDSMKMSGFTPDKDANALFTTSPYWSEYLKNCSKDEYFVLTGERRK